MEVHNKHLIEHLEQVTSFASDNDKPFVEVSLPIMAMIINQLNQLENIYNQ